MSSHDGQIELLQPLRSRAGGSIDPTPIRGLIERIIARWKPEQIWLFGSRARGQARPESDWDLLVVVPDDLPERAVDWNARWEIRKGLGVSADVIPCPASDFRDARTIANTLSYEVTHFGVLLYER